MLHVIFGTYLPTKKKTPTYGKQNNTNNCIFKSKPLRFITHIILLNQINSPCLLQYILFFINTTNILHRKINFQSLACYTKPTMIWLQLHSFPGIISHLITIFFLEYVWSPEQICHTLFLCSHTVLPPSQQFPWANSYLSPKI